MADDVNVRDADGNSVPIAADEIGGRKFQRFKATFGADGSATDVSSSNPLPSVDSAAATAIAAVETAVRALGATLGTPVTVRLTNGTSALDVTSNELHVRDATARTSLGATSDAAVSAGAAGSINAKLRQATSQLEAIKTAVELIDNAISGTEMQVDVLTLPAISLAAGSNNIGRVDLASTPRNDLAATANFTTNAIGDVIAAQGSGVSIVVTSILVINAHATVSTKVEISNGSTVLVRGLARADGFGFAHKDERGIFTTSGNAAVRARCLTTGADVDVSISGYRVS